tara:strand:+ start:13 stop:705 length:693 start_codon:yes stop_codon:yes gene_type:complete
MKTGIIVLCRYSSSRLRGKILKKIYGKTILSIVIDQLKLKFSNDQIIVATSNHKSDRKIISHCIKNEFNYFVGDLEDVSKRFLDCANKYNFDYAVRINGDNVFIDTKSLDSMIRIAETNSYDLITNVPGRTFPYGMSIEIININYYKSVISNFSNANKEHVTNWFYDNPELVNSYIYLNDKFSNLNGIKLAVDDERDLKNCELIYNKLGFNVPISLEIISNILSDISLLK